MIAYLIGKIHDKSKDSITLLTDSGVGYQVKLSIFALAELKVGGVVEFHIYTKVSDQAIDLYGFNSVIDRTFFTTLLTVSGVGPKSALGILNLGSVEDIAGAISRGDAKYLTTVQGMGKKTAERLCVELRSKVSALHSDTFIDTNTNSQVINDVVDGLMAMGYTREEVVEVVKPLDVVDATAEELLRLTLRQLSR